MCTLFLNYYVNFLGIIQYYDNQGQRVKVENFSDAFYKPDGLYEAGMLDHIFRGMIKTHTQAEDLHVKEEMTNKMFMDSKYGFGLDLVAQIIQQGLFLFTFLKNISCLFTIL